MENCDGVNQILNLNTILHSHENSSLYSASCDDGYSLLHGDRDYECKNQQWIPEMNCERKETNEVTEQPTLMTTSHARSKYSFSAPQILLVCNEMPSI